MNKNFPTVMAFSVLLVFETAGCGRKPADTKTQIDQSAQAMAQAEPIKPTATAAPTATPAPAPVQQMNEALASYKSGNLEDAVTRFQKMRAQTAMSPQQLMALNDAMAAVMGDIYARAAKGDARAIAAVNEYQRMQNNRQK